MRDHSDDWLTPPSGTDERLAELGREIEELRQNHIKRQNTNLESGIEVGFEYLEALASLQKAKDACDDPRSTTNKQLANEFEEAVLRLAKATDALIRLSTIL